MDYTVQLLPILWTCTYLPLSPSSSSSLLPQCISPCILSIQTFPHSIHQMHITSFNDHLHLRFLAWTRWRFSEHGDSLRWPSLRVSGNGVHIYFRSPMRGTATDRHDIYRGDRIRIDSRTLNVGKMVANMRCDVSSSFLLYMPFPNHLRHLTFNLDNKRQNRRAGSCRYPHESRCILTKEGKTR